MTTIYLIRHSLNNLNVNNISNSDNMQLNNEKSVLSVEGEENAKKASEISELQNIDAVYSSNYVRAISTAKYIADKNNLPVNVVEEFGERKFGINDWSEKPENFEQRQFDDENFKTPNGESRKEVADRMYNALINVLNENKDKKVGIVSHAGAITFLFMKYGEYKDKALYFKDKLLMDNTYKWRAPEVWKLVFDEEKLINIENIRED